MPSATSLKLDHDMKERLQRLAQVRKRSAHWLMREAIERYLHVEERHEQLMADLAGAWEEFELGGEHVEAEAADAWLAKLEAGKDEELPAWRV